MMHHLILAMVLQANSCDVRGLSGLRATYVRAKQQRDARVLQPLWREALACGMPGQPFYSRFELLAADVLSELADEHVDGERNRVMARHLLLNIASDHAAEPEVRRDAGRRLAPIARPQYD
jgi:hypothetical protein